MDEYSWFPLVEIAQSLVSQVIIPLIDKIFSEYRIPKKVKTDNGSPFQGEQFKEFSFNLGFVHHRVTPLWPQANRTVERFMKTMMKAIRCAFIEQKHWK